MLVYISKSNIKNRNKNKYFNCFFHNYFHISIWVYPKKVCLHPKKDEQKNAGEANGFVVGWDVQMPGLVP